mgnify:CR=1 FL=1
MTFLNLNPNNQIYCKDTVIIGNPALADTTPINIVGRYNRQLLINGETVDPPDPFNPEWKSMFAFVSKTGETPISLIINPNGGITGNTVTTRTGYQEPEILLIPVPNSSPAQAQVFMRGSITAVSGFVSTANAGQTGALINLPQGLVSGTYNYAPPGTGELHFLNAGEDNNTLLGCQVTGKDNTVSGAVVNENGGSFFSLDGISFFVDYTPGGTP